VIGFIVLYFLVISFDYMPITHSAKKALQRSQVLRERNIAFVTPMKDAIRNLRQKAKKGVAITTEEVNKVCSTIDKVLKRKIIHQNNAARKKSRVMRMANTSAKR